MEKKLIHIINTEKDINNYLKLTDNEIAFLKWLSQQTYLDDHTYFEKISALPTPTEF